MQNLLDKKQIPVFIISYNRLACLQKLISWLELKGFVNIIILDNNSSYEPLLSYLGGLSHKVISLKENLGHLALYKCGLFDDVINSQYYILTDPDVIPIQDCPDDFLDIAYEFLQRNDEYTKVGMSLKIDDLPDYYEPKQIVIDWESQFHSPKIEFEFDDIKMHRAIVDTTFALYRPAVDCNEKKWWSAVRTAYPYQARHLAWYDNSSEPTSEEIFYKETAAKNITSWTNDSDIKKRYKKTSNLLRGFLSFIKDYVIFFTRKSFWQDLKFKYKRRFKKF